MAMAFMHKSFALHVKNVQNSIVAQTQKMDVRNVAMNVDRALMGI